ncbi:MAG: hypothetical protein IJR47_04500, partial [Clostridia bacterium]|nr:hypothetical protein [Clostridia bacterium]
KTAALSYNAMGYKVIKDSENLCIAPVPLGANIGLYAVGAVDEGRDQAEELICETDYIKENHAALLQSVTKGTEQESFAGLFLDKAARPKEEFLQSVGYFGTYFETLDYYDFVSSQAYINNLVSEKTNGKTPAVLEQLYPRTTMVFVSAFRFKEHFGEEVGHVFSSNKSFMGNETEFYNIASAKIRLYENDNITFLSIPLENGFEYEVVMANDGNLSALTMADIKGFRDNAKETVAAISLPAMKYSGTVELKETLKTAGFTEAFAKVTLIGNLTSSIKTKVDKVDQALSFEILKKDRLGEYDIKASKTILIDKPYYYMISDGNTGCNVIMGKKSK